MSDMPKEYRLARLVATAHETRAVERAAAYAKRVGREVFAYRTKSGWACDITRPLGACIMARPSGVVEKIPGPIV